MKRVIYHLFLAISLFSMTSCLTGGLEDLPVYEDANITSVSAVQYRYISDEKSPASGEYLVKDVNMTYTSEIDVDAGLVQISVSTPDNFPAEELGNLSTENLLIAVSISTAARITPEANSPKLGVPGDWSKPNNYVVEAANGTKKNWTIEIVSLKK